MAHIAKSLEIPQDIIDNVIAEVGDDTRLLKQCSLVSFSFLLPSRKKLFSKITLRNDQTCRGIHQLLIQNPVIQSFVRAITLKGSWDWQIPEWMDDTSLPAILQLPLRHLEAFSIKNCYNRTPWDWRSFTSEMKDALSNIIHSPSLKSLSLEAVTNLPTTFFPQIVHLTTLELRSLSPYDFDNENSSLLTSKGVAPMATNTVPVIDRCVWYVKGIEMYDSPTEPIFLPFICRLRFFEMNLELGSATWQDFDLLCLLTSSLSISLTSPATLEHLKFNISFRGNSDEFDLNKFYEDIGDDDVWKYLDSITTHPIGSRLQRVDINVDYSFSYYNDSDGRQPDEDKVLEALLDSLPLLHTKGILFVEAVVWR